ncbi:polysaccharide biosynthesis protein GumE [Hyphomicrobium sp.]|uniref:polysaccharide biosynthesis protein GumE n=1 Tax=Hyphomicrobium sp. TaxID=82 RepID=UPI0025B8412D|nr:polysaccharide biosynthesis protein GumE [Hyphomicrobium sp.]MCC7251282.1 polysaccharide biosynthesis protein GumE [Hyphomicrobium sp.]
MRPTGETSLLVYPATPLPRGAAGFELAPALVLIGSVGFNAGLAFFNAHIAPVPTALVIVTEAALVSTAMGLALLAWRPQMAPSLALMAALALFAVFRGLLMAAPDPKLLRDVILIPTFMMLGMASDDRQLARTVIALHTIVFAVFLLEALAPQAYSDLLRIQDYYIKTRGNKLDEFYNTNSELFISATRPNERFFSFVDAPRMSSIFLEPVSLGNYCSIVTVFVCSCFRRLGTAGVAYLTLTTAAMLVGCDGRLATATCALIIVACIIATWLPPRSAVLYLPATLAFVFALVIGADLKPGSDDFPGRLAHTVKLLMSYDVPEILGLSNEFIFKAMDSGVAYLITTQSLPGLLLIWAYIGWGAREDTAEQVRFTHGLSLYLALSMMVSYSFLTIKTGALLWFIQGTLQAASLRSVNRRFLNADERKILAPREDSSWAR